MSALQPMRVLMTADTVGGVWTYALELARALRPHGVEITLATMGAPLSEDQRRDAGELAHVTVYESTYKLCWMNNPWDDVEAAGDWLREVAAAVQPDLVHLNDFAHGHLGWPAPVLVVGHSCVCSWWEAVHGEAAPPAWDRYREAVARGLRAADAVAAPTRAMLEALGRHYGPLPERQHVVYNGRDPARWRPQEPEPYVLAAGRVWDEAKGIGRLARVAPRLAWPVRIAGDATHPDGGTACFQNAELLGRLSQEELAEVMGRASIFAHPARYEPFGLGVLEAGLAGCALVLGDIPSLREVWGDAALFAADEDELAAALQILIESPTLRQEYAGRARRRARRYAPRRMAQRYLALYRQLLATPVSV